MKRQMLARRRFGGDERGNLDVNLRSLPFLAVDIHFELVAVEQPQAFVHVADADAAAVNLGKPLRAKCPCRCRRFRSAGAHPGDLCEGGSARLRVEAPGHA